MTQPASCKACGVRTPPRTPEGLCPACLLAEGLRRDTDSVPGAAVGDGWRPPAVETIAALFPELRDFCLLGRGGMGAVYRARQTSLDRLVAVKILPPEIGRDPAFAERFSHEARALARLSHPNIVTVHDFGRRGDSFFFLMEFVDGASLRERMDAGRLAPRDALAIVPQVCDALQYAHDQGVVHRDIKPDNILLTRQGRVKIADFGLAKLLLGAEEDNLALAAQMLATGRAVGTPQYMAPEQLSNPRAVDHRADIYSLGVVLYQLLTGELPPERFVPPSARNGSTDARLDAVVERALARDPDSRFQQMSQVKSAVEGLTGATPVPAPAPAAVQARRAWIAWAAVPVLAGAAVLAVVGVRLWPAPPRRPALPPRTAPPPAAALTLPPAPPALAAESPRPGSVADSASPAAPPTAGLSAQSIAFIDAVKAALPEGWTILRVEPDPKPVYRPRGAGLGFVVGTLTTNVAGNPLGAGCNVSVMRPDYDETRPLPKDELMTQMANRIAEHPAQVVYAGPEAKILVWPKPPAAWPTLSEDLLAILRRPAAAGAADR